MSNHAQVTGTPNPISPPKKGRIILIIFSTCVLIALFFGWQSRSEYLITAQYGLGYALGIAGGLMMLLLLIYPLKKRFHHSRLMVFSTRSWFRIHMVLGILGPLLVLFHCNFRMGSTNSNVALASMLLMVSSGLFGRFIYSKIHYGLYGNKIQMKELLQDKLLAKKQLDQGEHQVQQAQPLLMEKIRFYEQALQTRRSVLGSLFASFRLSLSTRFEQRHLRLKLKSDNEHRESIEHAIEYLASVRKIAGLTFYERLFSLWHMLHMPIFFMLVVTGFVHVYAVHVY